MGRRPDGRHCANADRFFLRGISVRSGGSALASEVWHWSAADSDDTGKDGAALDAGAAVCAAGGRVLSARGIYTAPQRVGTAGGRSVSEVVRAAAGRQSKDGRGRPSLQADN